MQSRSSKNGAKASETLYRQTVDMERKLGQLKNRMEVENEQRRILASKKETTGSYWRSGNQKLGGVRTYQKDVKAKHANVRPRPKQKAGAVAKHDFTTKNVSDWVMADSLSWLTSLGLASYGNKFAENEIFGDILLDLGLDDLDYMGIKVLAHRKKLLKGIEELKRNGKGSTNAPPPPPADSSAGLNVGSEARAPEEKKKQHWSDVKPISENVVKEPAAGSDVYDEAAEAAAFRAAVADWRSGGVAKSGPGKENPGEKVLAVKASPAKPKFSFASIADDSGASSGWSNPFATSADTPEESKAPEVGGALLDGTYDEAAEAAAFKRAVEEWRNPGAARATKKSNNDDNEEGTGTDYDDLSKSSQVAQSLAEKMEADFKKKKQELVERREAAEVAMKERLAQKEKELNEMYANKENELGELDGWGQAEEKDGESKEGEGKEGDDELKGGFEEEEVSALAQDLSHLSPSKDVGVEVLETEVYSPDAKEEGGFEVEEPDSSDDEAK
ncbi:hypothetical protein TrCOL_g5546 [Triparma columacea]|uniref:SAM domain-containing protein n=1 Tax=Triparma columacea TaxID=722753 RepID=A0A9W7GRW2_9STRA|nr:hypothetical protein TrCOL_g5546 [Triparma columacea]